MDDELPSVPVHLDNRLAPVGPHRTLVARRQTDSERWPEADYHPFSPWTGRDGPYVQAKVWAEREQAVSRRAEGDRCEMTGQADNLGEWVGQVPNPGRGGPAGADQEPAVAADVRTGE